MTKLHEPRIDTWSETTWTLDLFQWFCRASRDVVSTTHKLLHGYSGHVSDFSKLCCRVIATPSHLHSRRLTPTTFYISLVFESFVFNLVQSVQNESHRYRFLQTMHQTQSGLYLSCIMNVLERSWCTKPNANLVCTLLIVCSTITTGRHHNSIG